MKRLLLTIFAVLMVFVSVSAQQFLASSKTAFTNYIKRVYEAEHNEGCKFYSFDDKQVLITVISVKKSPTMQRAGEIKALRTAGEFLKGAQTKSYSKLVMNEDGELIETPVDVVETTSMTVIDKMEILTSFINDEGRMVYIYLKEIQ